MDRFLIRIRMGYPLPEEEVEVLERRRSRKKEEVDLDKLSRPAQVEEMQKVVEEIHVDRDVERYIVELVERTRRHKQLELGSSPRGSLALMKLGRARALLKGRDYVLPDDVKDVAVTGLAHRLILKPDPWIRGVKTEDVVQEILRSVPVPQVD